MKPSTGSFFSAARTVLAGTLFYNGALLLASPFLTRLYGAADFGVFAIYLAIVMPGAIFVTGRYELGLPAANTELHANSLVLLSMGLALTGTGILGLVLWLGEAAFAALSLPLTGALLWVTIAGVFSTAVFQIFYYSHIREHNFQIIMQTRIVQVICVLSFQIGLSLYGAIMLPAGVVVGNLAGLAWMCARPLFGAFDISVVSELATVARVFRKQALFSMPSGVLNALGRQIPSLALVGLFSVSAAGLYALAFRVMITPLTIVGQAVSQVFFAKARKKYEDGLIINFASDLVVVLIGVSLPVAAVAAPFLKSGFGVLFGDQWADAGLMSAWMLPWMVVVFITSPIATMVIITGTQSRELLFQIILAVGRLAVLVIIGSIADLIPTIIAFALFNFVCWMGFMIWIWRLIDLSVIDILLQLLPAFGLSAALFVWSCLVPYTFGLWSMAAAVSGMLLLAVWAKLLGHIWSTLCRI